MNRAGRAGLLLLLAVMTTAVRLLRAWVPVRRWGRLLGDPAPAPARSESPAVLAAAVPDPVALRVGRLADSLEHRLPWPTTCLDRAVAAHLLLRVGGRGSTLVLGLRAGDLTAPSHAWVEDRDGRPVVGRFPPGTFVPTTVFGHRPSAGVAFVSRFTLASVLLAHTRPRRTPR